MADYLVEKKEPLPLVLSERDREKSGVPVDPSWTKIQSLALILFFSSGLTSLAYESIFFVLLRRVFGVTAYATSTVVAAFMAGLALGSFCFGCWAKSVGQGSSTCMA